MRLSDLILFRFLLCARFSIHKPFLRFCSTNAYWMTILCQVAASVLRRQMCYKTPLPTLRKKLTRMNPAKVLGLSCILFDSSCLGLKDQLFDSYYHAYLDYYSWCPLLEVRVDRLAHDCWSLARPVNGLTWCSRFPTFLWPCLPTGPSLQLVVCLHPKPYRRPWSSPFSSDS